MLKIQTITWSLCQNQNLRLTLQYIHCTSEIHAVIFYMWTSQILSHTGSTANTCMCADARLAVCYSDGTKDKIYSGCILTLRWTHSSWQTHTYTHTPQHRTQKLPFCPDFLGLLACECVCSLPPLCSTLTDSQPNYLYGMINIISIDSQNYSVCVRTCVWPELSCWCSH